MLVLAGLLIIALMPEAWFVLPAFDAMGLDIVVVLVALELGRYWDGVMRTIAVPCKITLRVIHESIILSSRLTARQFAMAGVCTAVSLLVGTKVALHVLGIN
jgi:hypothetical protein